MTLQDIKNKGWERISKYNNLNDEDFNTSATSFKINEKHNLVIWWDIESDSVDSAYIAYRCYIVSVRYNPYDDLFGDDIGAEYCTGDISQEQLNEAIDYVLSHEDLH